MAVISLAIVAIGIFAAWQTEHGKHGDGLAIIIAQSADARLATADTANRVLTLPAGSEVQVITPRADWVYAILPNNLRGWVPAKSTELVRM